MGKLKAAASGALAILPFAAAQALETIYTKLKRDQTTQGSHDQLMTFKKFNDLIGVDEKYALAEKFGVRS